MRTQDKIRIVLAGLSKPGNEGMRFIDSKGFYSIKASDMLREVLEALEESEKVLESLEAIKSLSIGLGASGLVIKGHADYALELVKKDGGNAQ